MPQKTQDKIPKDQTQTQIPASLRTNKEAEIMAGIKTLSETADQKAIEDLTQVITEARQAVPEPEIPPDVADAQVTSPGLEAGDVIAKGPTINLSISENTYHAGLHQKVGGFVVDKIVVGASSLLALAMWTGRLIKMASKHAIKLVFRKEESR